jgi:hypothetical protein
MTFGDVTYMLREGYTFLPNTTSAVETSGEHHSVEDRDQHDGLSYRANQVEG